MRVMSEWTHRHSLIEQDRKRGWTVEWSANPTRNAGGRGNSRGGGNSKDNLPDSPSMVVDDCHDPPMFVTSIRSPCRKTTRPAMHTLIATTAWNALGFALGGPEIVILLILLAIPVGIAVVVLVIVRATRSSASPPSAPLPRPIDERLRELDALREQELITEEEHEERRKAIVDQL